MNSMISASRRYACVLGAFLVIEGVWGLFSEVVFGIFTTNMLRALIHLSFGLLAVAAGVRGSDRGVLKVLGAVMLAVGVLRLLPVTNELMINLLAVNMPVAVLNIALGLTTLAVASTVSRRRHIGRAQHA